MNIFFAIIVGLIGFALIGKYQYRVGGWMNAYYIYAMVVIILFVGYLALTGQIPITPQ